MCLEYNKSIRGLIWETVIRRSSTYNLDLYYFLMYDNAENALSQKQVVPNGERTFVSSTDICGYSFATEIQNSTNVILVSKAIFKPWSLDRSPNAPFKSDDRWWVLDTVKCAIISSGVVFSRKYLSHHWQSSWKWLTMDCFTMFWPSSFSSRESLSSDNISILLLSTRPVQCWIFFLKALVLLFTVRILNDLLAMNTRQQFCQLSQSLWD